MTATPMIQSGKMTKGTSETVAGMYVIRRAVETNSGTIVGTGGALGYAYDQSDAKLWASAPELLDALRQVIDETAYYHAAFVSKEWQTKVREVLRRFRHDD